MQNIPDTTPTLHPIDIEIDNDASDRYTALRIEAPDTIGFLYEFTNALALNGIHIAQVSVATEGNRVRDTLVRHRRARAEDHLSGAPTRAARDDGAGQALHPPAAAFAQPRSGAVALQRVPGRAVSRPSWPDELASLERPEVLEALARLLGVSEFLWDDFLRMQYANLFPVVTDRDTVDRAPVPVLIHPRIARSATWRAR